jgi:2-polyprenyl-3-methyl-5-hydroxy-6-metoxy-1,4-benzoquinol methylase
MTDEGNKPIEKSGEYADRGEYHRHLDKNWSYYPIYIRKIAIVENLLNGLNAGARVLDAGCGEGVLVEKFRSDGFDIVGCDLHYESQYVKKADILAMPFDDREFDAVLFLDVIEHLSVLDQQTALLELRRLLKDTGTLIMSVPNLAHAASRQRFFFTGRLVRTAAVTKHPGDRPIAEYLDMISDSGFDIARRIPIKLTFPSPVDRILNKLMPGPYEKLIYWKKWNPDLCFLNLLVLHPRRD